MFFKLSSILPWHFILFIPISFIGLIFYLGFLGFFLAIFAIVAYYIVYLAVVLASAKRKMIVMNQTLFSCLGLIARVHPLDFERLASMPGFFIPKSIKKSIETNFYYARDNENVSVSDVIPNSFIDWINDRPYIKVVFAQTLIEAIPQSLLIDPKVVDIIREINETLGSEAIKTTSSNSKMDVIEGEIIDKS